MSVRQIRVHYVYEYEVDTSYYEAECEAAVDFAQIDLETPDILFNSEGHIDHAEWVE